MDAKVSGIDPSQKDTALSLLTLTFEPEAEPSGFVTLHFSGGGAVRLEVECIEAALEDLGAAWATRANRPMPATTAVMANGRSAAAAFPDRALPL